MRDDTVYSPSRRFSGPPRWIDPGRIRFYAAIVLVVNVFLFALHIWFGCVVRAPNSSPPGWDFAVFWSASWLALHGPAVNVFDTALIERIALPLQNILPSSFITPWTYPPTFLLVVLPAALLPFAVSYVVYLVAGITFALNVCVRILTPVRRLSWWLPVVAFPASWVVAHAGQNSFFTFGLMGLGLIYLDKRPWLAGLFFGMLAIKPQLGVVIPVALVFGRNWRAFASAALTVSVFCGIAGLLFGFDTLAQFSKSLPAFNQFVVENSGHWPHGISTVFGAARHYGVAVPLAYELHAVVAMLAVGIVAWLWAVQASFELRASALVLATVMVPSYLMPYDLLLLGLPILWLVRDGANNGWMRGDGVLIVSAWLSPLSFFTPPNWAASAYAPLFALSLLLVVVRRRLVHRAVRANECPGTALVRERHVST